MQRPSRRAKKIGVPRKVSSPVLASLTNFEIGILSARKLAQTNLTEGAEAELQKKCPGSNARNGKGRRDIRTTPIVSSLDLDLYSFLISATGPAIASGRTMNHHNVCVKSPPC